MERTHQELNGQRCFEFEQPQPRQNICCSRSFGSRTETIGRNGGSSCQPRQKAAQDAFRRQRCQRHPSLHQHRSFQKDLPQYYNSASGKLPFPTNDLLTIATEANRHLQRIFREGYGYKKAGVLLGLAPEGHQQLPLFADTIKQKRNGRIELKVKRQRLNEAIEDIVQRYGNTLSTWVALQSGHQLESRTGGNRIGINFPQITLQVGAIS